MTAREATDTIACSGAGRTTVRRDVLSAYLVTGARVASWAVISAIVYRKLGAAAFAMLTLVRATVGLLSYASVGLSPAMVRKLAEADQALPVAPVMAMLDDPSGAPPVLDYFSKPLAHSLEASVRRVYASGNLLAAASAVLVFALGMAYGINVSRLHAVPQGLRYATEALAIVFSQAVAVRVFSEPAASLLQVRGRLALDNAFVACSEFVWLLATLILVFFVSPDLERLGSAYLLAGLCLCVLRLGAVRLIFRQDAVPRWRDVSWPIARGLLAFGIGVAIAQAADFLYSPIDYILINRLIGADVVAVYAPAVQFDSGLLLLVTGLAAALLPHSAVAHAAGDRAAVRQFYLRGTLLGLATLTPAAIAAYFAAPLLFKLWLGSPMYNTQAILPLVLFSTIVGGSSAVGRSILLSMGKVRAFSTSVVVAGLANVALSYVFVRYLHLGLNGIIYGTIVAVFFRCAVWMPWYVFRSLGPTGPTQPGSER